MKKWITAIKKFGAVKRGETYQVDEWRANELIRLGLAVPYEVTRSDTKMDVAPLNKMMPPPDNEANEYAVEPVGMSTTVFDEPDKRPRTIDGPSVRFVPDRKLPGRKR
jgi:hypothetical protein